MSKQEPNVTTTFSLKQLKELHRSIEGATAELRAKAYLLNKIEKISRQEIGNYLGVGKSTVQYWVEQYEKGGTK